MSLGKAPNIFNRALLRVNSKNNAFIFSVHFKQTKLAPVHTVSMEQAPDGYSETTCLQL